VNSPLSWKWKLQGYNVIPLFNSLVYLNTQRNREKPL
jgi:hypothetical protein